MQKFITKMKKNNLSDAELLQNVALHTLLRCHKGLASLLLISHLKEIAHNYF